MISKYARHPVKVISPYFETTKGELVSKFSNKDVLQNTFSCYNPKTNGSPCGNCPACLRKAIALETNGIDYGYQLSEEIIQEYIKKIHTYDQDRISRFFIFLSKRKSVYAIDLDGVLCEERGPYANRSPIQQNIDKVNGIDGYIVIYSARLEMDRSITERWLQKNNVRYDSLILNKLPYTKLIDDRAKEMP